MIIEQMANELGLPEEFVVSLANGASHEYKKYEIPKTDGRLPGYLSSIKAA